MDYSDHSDSPTGQSSVPVSRASPSQPNTNPRGYVNAISAVGRGLVESPVIVLQETTTVTIPAGIVELKKEEGSH